MSVDWHNKYPEETAVMGVDWSCRLEGRNITSCDFRVIVGTVTVSSPAIDDHITKATVTGGIPGYQEVLCQAVTDDGEIMQEVATFQVLRTSDMPLP